MKKNKKHGFMAHLFDKMLSPKLWRRITSVVMALVVFLTTYMMILPALTIDLDTVAEEPGIEVAMAGSNADLLVSDDAPPSVEESQAGILEETSVNEEVLSEATEAFSGESEADSFEAETSPEYIAAEAGEITESDIPIDDNSAETFDDSLSLPEEFGGEPTEEIAENPEEFGEDITEGFVAENPEEMPEGLPAEEQESIDDVAESAELSIDGIEASEDTFDETEDEDINAVESASSHVLKAEGYDYRVTVSYTDEADVPEGAELLVTEIFSGETGYDQYVSEAAEALSTEKRIMSVNNARFFDITIINGDEPVEPKAPVTVLVELADNFVTEENAAVIHYTEEEVKEIEKVDPVEAAASIEEAAEADAAQAEAVLGETDEQAMEEAILDTEVPFIEPEPVEESVEENLYTEPMNAIAFMADSFSVYGFVTATIEKTVLASDGYNYKVSVTYGPDAGIPEDVVLSVEEITQEYPDYDAYLENVENALGKDGKSVEGLRLFDIKIVDPFDTSLKYQPAEGSPVDVRIELADTLNEDLSVLHFDEDQAEGELLDSGTEAGEEGTAVEFETDGFSVFAVAYTVDFEYSVNGEMYQFSLPGGGFISFTDLVKALGIVGNTNNSESEAETEEQTNDGTIDDAGVNDDAKKFVANIASIEFSNPELVWVGKTDTDITVGSLKDENGLECEYSTELTEEQIAEINAQTVKAGDWALISMQPFTSEESLTVTMKNGDIWTIRVTDAVTGTIINGDPVDGKAYALVIKHSGKYYTVFNDGTLRSVDGAYNPETNRIDVEMDYPLVWNYTAGNNPIWGAYHNLSIPSVASGFYENHLPLGYYNRYIDPRQDYGTRDEDKSNSNLKESCAIWFKDNKLYGYSGSNEVYLGISETGGLHIIGNQTEDNAIEVYLAETSVPDPNNETHNDHTVNHIDIAIAGNSSIKIPLAYGEYQNENGQVIYTANEEHHILEMTPDISIKTDDMKNAIITASAMVNGNRVELDDVFYITGYSQNDKTDENELDQVRIEGSFKVSNIPYADNADNDTEVCAARKANPIDYSVTVTKTVPVTVKYNGEELYADGQKLVINVPISLTASFNYWQENNKCPPLAGNQDWKDGKIIGSGTTMSGMDFDLAAAAAGNTSRPAIEINKIVQKEDGSYLETTTSYEVGVEVYYKEKAENDEDDLIGVGVDSAVDEETLSELTNGYTKLHNKQLLVGTDGIGAIYDYDVEPGLLYIKEDPNKVEEYLTGKDGKKYQYLSSHMETEYVWRTNGDEDKLHRADGMTGVPEVLGAYTYEGSSLSNTFLPFYIYNVYKEVETVDVPVDKTWPELDDSYTWTATFDLEEVEVHVSGPEHPEANTDLWRKVEDAGSITISKGDEEAARTFTDLPKYRYYKNEDGEESVYKIIYSVDEIAYEVRHNGEIINKWDKDHSLSVGEVYYRPVFPHDAGDANDEMHLTETDPLFYHVIVENHESQVFVRDELTNLRIQKTWEEGKLEEAGVPEENANATFQLMRYVTNTYHDYDSSVYDGSDCVVRLYDENDNLVQSMTVKKGSKMKIVATFAGTGTIHYMMNGSGQDYPISRSWAGDDNPKSGGAFTITGDTEITKYVHSWDGQVEPWNGAVITERHLEYYTSQGSQVKLDTDFENEKHYIVLNSENDWSETIASLPLVEEGGVHNGSQTISTYSYYFEEVESNPTGFYAEFTDGEGVPIGDSEHRITNSNTTVHAENKPIPPFVVEKIWRGVPEADGFPSVYFDLYKKGTNGQPDQKVYEHIELKSTPDNPETDYRWVCPDLLEEGAQYYAIETTKNGQVGDLIWELYGYSAFDGTDEDQATLRIGTTPADDDAKKAYVQGNTGTIRIQNKLNKYMEFDIDKKWVELRPEGTGGSWYTTTSADYMKRNLVFGFKVIRRIRRKIDGSYGTFASYTDQVENNEKYQSDQQYIIQDWTEIGNELLAGYDSEGHAVFDNNVNNFWLKDAGGDWHFQIHENSGSFGNNTEGGDNVGLPLYGLWYNQETGQYEVVLYEYSVREVGVYANINKDPYVLSDWFMSVTPPYSKAANSEYEPFPRMPLQDQNRIINYQASNLRVRKNWYGSGKTDVEEIYLKIYRAEGQGEWKDFTQTIIDDKVNNHNWQNYVDAENIDENHGWLILRPDGKDNELIIHKLLIYEAGVDGTAPYRYAVKEVGYKRNGVVYTDSSDLQLIEPRYDKVIGTYIEGIGMMVDYSKIDEYLAAATGGRMEPSGHTTINIGNNPIIDLTVKKIWQNSKGQPYTPDDNAEVTFKIRQVRENKTTHEQQESYVSIGGDTVLTLKKTGQRIIAKENVPEYSEPDHMYPASENPAVYTITSSDNTGADWTYYVDGLIGGYVDANKQEWSCTYYIEEVGSDGFEISFEGNDGIDVGGKTVKIINRKTDKGALNIIKTVEAGSPADTTEAFTYQVVLTPEAGTSIDVSKLTFRGTGTISGKTIQVADSVVTITLAMQGTGRLTIGNIPKNTTYVVSELSEHMPQGWRQVGSVVYSDETKTIAPEEYTDTATVTNKCEYGALKITKAVTVDNAAPYGSTLADGIYSFSITGPDEYSETGSITVTEGVATSSIELGNLVPGEYIITENPTSNGTTLSGRSGGVSDGERGIKLTVGAGSVAADNIAAFTNNINTTSLEIDKTVVSVVPGDADVANGKTFTFTVTVTKADGNKLTGTFGGYTFNSDGQTTVTTKGTQKVTVSGLPQGATYKVTEAEDSDFVNTSTTGDEGTLGTTTSTAAFVNTRKTGDLIVTKSLRGKGEDAAPTGTYTYPIKVTVTIGSDNYYVSYNSTAGKYELTKSESTLNVTNGTDLTIGGLPVSHGGTVLSYKVEEVNLGNVAVTDYTNVQVAGTTVESVDNITITPTTPGEANLVNVYERDKGSLNIEKKVTVNGQTIEDTTLVDGTYSFTVSSAAGVTPATTKNVTVTILKGVVSEVSGDAILVDGKALVTNLPTGSYTVTENTNGLAEKGITLAESPSTPVIVNKDQTAGIPTASFTNNKDVIDYSVKKVWTGVTTENDYVIQVQLKQTVESDAPSEQAEPVDYGDPVLIKKDANGKWEYTWENLPKKCLDTGTNYGKDYTYSVQEIAVYEEEPDNTAGSSAQPDNLIGNFAVSVVDNMTQLTSTITNKLFKVEILKVDKDDSDKVLGNAKFTLKKETSGSYLPYPTEEEKNTKVTPDSGTDKGKVAFTELPIGKYELVEVESPPGYAKLVGSVKFEIKSDGTVEPDFGANEQYVSLDDDTLVFTVQNEKGAVLPSTGGVGTDVFYYMGTAMTALGSGGVLIRRRRRKSKKSE